MILLREIQENDLDALERFAQIPGFINLPNDKDILREKIQKSIASFREEVPGKAEIRATGKYIFSSPRTWKPPGPRHFDDRGSTRNDR